MIRIHNIRTEVRENLDIKKIAAKKLNVKENEIKKVVIHKKSLDARNKKYFSFVLDLDVEIANEDKYLNVNITKVLDESYKVEITGTKKMNHRPIVVGAGPAGLFSAYELAKYGYNPIVIERGEPIDKRVQDVENFWNNDVFKTNSNVQFGEGGAGTFSDGKLNTLVKDKFGRMKEVFETFVECGAPDEILYEAMPHIGTDRLRQVVKNLRNKIISLGGEFRYNSLMEGLVIQDNKLTGVIVNGKTILTEVVVLAIGHSARDTFKMLYDYNVLMEPKPFAVGVRIIHPQKLINENQYPIHYPFLPSAPYKLTYKNNDGRGVYSFCMCPGGYVVDARSKKDGVVVNGMSNFDRASGFANSAIVVTVGPSDFGENVFDGVNFQESLEQKAYELGSGYIPCQKYLDYKNNVVSDITPLGVLGKTHNANINALFPTYINSALKNAMDHFDTIIPGFKDGVMLAPESRTSSPVRIKRDENLQSNIEGLYPAGEGAGYAGGITTSAIDGIKIFEEIVKIYNNK